MQIEYSNFLTIVCSMYNVAVRPLFEIQIPVENSLPQIYVSFQVFQKYSFNEIWISKSNKELH